MVGIHVAAIVLAIIIPAFQHLFNPRKKEIVTFVAIDDGSAPAPITDIQPVEVESLPEPEPPPPEPKPVVETPIPTNPPPKVVEKPKPEPKPKPKPKPKWKPAPVVKQNRRITRDSKKPAPVKPTRQRITASDIRKALGTAGGTPSEFAAYYNTIFSRFYSVWQVPVGTAYGVSAQASITVGTDGTVSNRRLIRGSVNAGFDQSVQTALNTVNRLPRPPANLPSRTITIDFVPQ